MSRTVRSCVAASSLCGFDPRDNRCHAVVGSGLFPRAAQGTAVASEERATDVGLRARGALGGAIPEERFQGGGARDGEASLAPDARQLREALLPRAVRAVVRPTCRTVPRSRRQIASFVRSEPAAVRPQDLAVASVAPAGRRRSEREEGRSESGRGSQVWFVFPCGLPSPPSCARRVPAVSRVLVTAATGAKTIVLSVFPDTPRAKSLEFQTEP